MFTGIILHTGTIETFERRASGARMRIRTPDPEPFARGESLAVNGVCLTVLPESDGALVADVSEETLSRTTLGTLASLLSVTTEGEFAVYRWSYPVEYAELVVSKGSIAVDGVSLTVVDPENGTFGAALIPETLRRTNLGTAHVGDAVNLEFDMIAKHVRRLVAPYLPARS
jgi:riboflavin synthase